MITRNGRPSRAPYCGNQLKSVCILVKLDCTRPMASPVSTVGHTFVNAPMSAAPRAGIRYPNVNTPDDSWIIGDARITATAPMSDARMKLACANSWGE